jgi:hypothetical protein
MTTERQYKKYRKRVSNERVEKAARAIAHHYKIRTIAEAYQADYRNCLTEARLVLEADAEVIEASGLWFNFPIRHLRIHWMDNREFSYETLEQFKAEWEELPL